MLYLFCKKRPFLEGNWKESTCFRYKKYGTEAFYMNIKKVKVYNIEEVGGKGKKSIKIECNFYIKI